MQTATQVPLVRLVPTIKGIFVNSHIEAVRRDFGATGVAELERRMARPLRFRANDDVPISEEVRLLENALDLAGALPMDPAERAFEAGRLHFRNFSTTPYARVIFALFPKNFRFMMLHAATIAERVFRGVRFDVRETGPRRMELRMENADYPIHHFRGLFHEWMLNFGVKGRVTAQDLGGNSHIYRMEWDA